jgi:hypothetical protein
MVVNRDANVQRTSGGYQVRIVLIATVMAAGVFAGWTEVAHAGTYTFHSCRTPDGDRADISSWRVFKGSSPSLLVARNRCPNGPFELEMLSSKPQPADQWFFARFLAPADTTISGYQFWRSVQLAKDYGWRYRERTSNGTVDLDKCYSAYGCWSKGDAMNPFGASNVVRAVGRTDVNGLELVVTCALDDGSTATCPATAPGARVQLHRADITLSDQYSPVIASPPTGPLVDPGRILTGEQPVSIAATDKGGGVYQAQFEVDGEIVGTQTIDPNGGSCAPPFPDPVPCKLSASGTVSLDTVTIPDGDHSLRILVTDATETNVAAWGPVTIHTANAFCNPQPIAAPSLDLDASVLGRKHRRLHAITVGHGRKLRVSGRLSGPGNEPVADAPVCVVARDSSAGAALRAYRTVTTDAKGRFSYLLRPGASRRVQFVHHVDDGAIVADVVVRVRAAVSLRGSRRTLRNGQTLHMSGKLRARPFPPRGVIVELQARRAGGWQTFATTRTNRKGRFGYAYTFTRTQGVQRYDLRARVPKQAVYPFESGASRPLRVFVFG